VQYHTAAEALEAATSELAAKDARIAELEAREPDIEALRLSHDAYVRRLAACEAELAEAQAHIDGLEGEPTKALAMKWKARAEQAEAELATLEAEFARTMDTHNQYVTAKEAELATVRAALREATRAVKAAHKELNDHDCECSYCDPDITATPPRRTPELEPAQEGERLEWVPGHWLRIRKVKPRPVNDDDTPDATEGK
jgi:chromosome segregation ATPase